MPERRDRARPIRVWLACSGLGRTQRGYEAFFEGLNRTLVGEPGLELLLYKGGGPAAGNETPLANLPRDSWLARRIGDAFTPGSPVAGHGYWVEQFTFFLSLLPRLAAGRPDIVYFSDRNLGDFLWHWRKRSRQRYRLLFCNGGPYPPPYPRFDLVQQVTPVYYARALAAGASASRQRLLPLGLQFEDTPLTDRGALRQQLGLPADRPIVLTVSAVNTSHKRLDYLIREVSALPQPRPLLVILGQFDAESGAVLRLADEMLGPDQHRITTVATEDVAAWYQCADVFVLASTREGFGLVMAEALGHGLPCLAHDYPIARYVLGEHGHHADFTQPGALTGLLAAELRRPHDPAARAARQRDVRSRFGWAELRQAYTELVRHCATLEPIDRDL
jgi:glycosyltransferase involved in cell wall biosynthesis